MKPIMHPATSRHLDIILQSQPHGILLTGGVGTGKHYLAKYIAKALLQTKKLSDYPYFKQLNPDEKEGIEAVRSIRDFLSLKTTGQASIRRILLINDAMKLGTAAQNALLKTLEEPPLDTIIILTATDSTRLLPTILSRVQTIQVRPLTFAQTREQLKATADKPQLERAYHLSGGAVGTILGLLNEPSNHSLLTAVDEAKILLQEAPYQRLLRVNSLSNEKERLMVLMTALLRILEAGLTQAVTTKNYGQVKRFHHTRQLVADAKTALEASAHSKLTLTQLLLNL